MVVAKLETDQTYHLTGPEPVGELDDFFERLLARADPGNVFVGFDFPIGLPHEYCERAGITDFTQFLRQLGSGPWAEFYEVVRDRRDIALHRPFYPFSAGGSKQEHLTEALEVDDMDALMRRCERKTPARPAASPLFWTLGAKQVGQSIWCRVPRSWMMLSFFIGVLFLLIVNIELILRTLITMLGGEVKALHAPEEEIMAE